MTDMLEAPKRYICRECYHVSETILSAPSPFDPADVITGCESCRGAECLDSACCVGACKRLSTSGVPGAFGFRYAWLCHDHYREWLSMVEHE